MSESFVNIGYMVSAACFIYGLKMLSHPKSARRGNLVSALGMLLAAVITLFHKGILDFRWIGVGLFAGSVIGLLAARFVAMTSMPEMVPRPSMLTFSRFSPKSRASG